MPLPRISTGRLAALIATACAAALSLGLPAGAGAFAWELPATTLSAGPNGSAGADVAVAPDGTTTIVYEWAFNDVSAGTSARWIKAATRPAGQSDFIYSDVSPPGANVGSAVNPRVVVSPNGATTVVWSEGGGDQIFAATRPPGQSSFPDPADKPPQLLSDPTLTSKTPELAAAGDGSVTAVWSAEGGLASSCPLVQYAIRMPGQSSFGPRGSLSVPGPTPCDGYPPFPQLAAAADGTTTTVWSRHNGSHDTIQSASRLPGQPGFPDPTQTPPENLSSPGKNATTPDVAVGANGQATVVWHDWTSLGQVESATRQPGSSTFESPEDVADGTYLNYNEPAAQVAYSPDGQTTVVFGYGEIFSSTRAPTSSVWGTPESISGEAISGEDRSIYPRIAVAPDGRETVVWLAGLNTNTSSIRSATRASGSSAWSTPETLAPDTGFWNIPAPRIAVGANGRATAAWTANTVLDPNANPPDIVNRRVQTVSSDVPPPSNDFKVISSRVRGSAIVSRVRVPGPGRISQRTYHRTRKGRSSVTRVACTASRRASRASTYTLTCRLDSATRKQRSKGPVRVKLQTTFAPTGGTARTTRRTVVFPSLKPR